MWSPCTTRRVCAASTRTSTPILVPTRTSGRTRISAIQPSPAYATWDRTYQTAAADQVAVIVRDAIRDLHARYPSVHYVVIVGDDAIVPFYRHQDAVVRAANGALDESWYPFVDPTSRTGRALA